MKFELFGQGKERVPNAVPPSNVEGTVMERAHTASERILTNLESEPELEGYTDVSGMYRAIPDRTLVVRREDPQAVLNLFEKDEPIEIKFVGNTPYANSVEWHPRLDGARGIDNAVLEGYGHMDGVVVLYGFEQPEGFFLEKHPESQQVFSGIDRVRVRTAAGLVTAKDVRFITVRTPILAFTEERMTEEEKDLLWEVKNGGHKTPQFIYRGFLSHALDTEKAADLSMAA
jgi:hypothetical protein